MLFHQLVKINRNRFMYVNSQFGSVQALNLNMEQSNEQIP